MAELLGEAERRACSALLLIGFDPAHGWEDQAATFIEQRGDRLAPDHPA
jgi:hypothetical protein